MDEDTMRIETLKVELKYWEERFDAFYAIGSDAGAELGEIVRNINRLLAAIRDEKIQQAGEREGGEAA